MQMQKLCRAVEILTTTSYTSVTIFYRGLTEVFIASPFCDQVHEGQVKRNASQFDRRSFRSIEVDSIEDKSQFGDRR